MNSITAIQNVSEVPSKLNKTETAEAAKKLDPAVSINGTSFNGTSNITTSTWGTTRSITIGNTSKDVNGSANVSWSLQDIMKGQGLNASTAMNTLYYNNAGTSHVGRLSTYHNATSSLDYVQLGLYNVANSGTVNTLNVYPEHTYTANEFWCASNIRVNGKRISVTSSAPTTISTGDIWIQI